MSEFVSNLRKHGVLFEEAASVFFDSLSATGDDLDHSFGQRRFVTFGVSSSGRRGGLLRLRGIRDVNDFLVRKICDDLQVPRP